MAKHNVQSVGNSDLSIILSHPVLAAAGFPADIALTGFKLEGQFLNTEQLLDNSKVVPLLSGDTISITNTNRSGSITFNCTRASGTLANGDIVAVANKLQELGDNSGGTLTVSYGFNGAVFKVTFFSVTVRSAPPLLMAGNDVPDYAVRFNYGDYKVEF
jgi:hypothetical protein